MTISRRKLHKVFSDLGAAPPLQDEPEVPGFGDLELGLVIEMAAERTGTRLTGPVEPSARIKRLVHDFSRAVGRELKTWANAHKSSFANGSDHDELYFDDSAYAVLMTLRGEAVGIGDGRWDHHFKTGHADRAIKDLTKFLLTKLHRWSHPGGGVLEAALEMEAQQHAKMEAAGDYEIEIEDDDSEQEDGDEASDDEDDDGAASDDEDDDDDEEEDDEDDEDEEREAPAPSLSSTPSRLSSSRALRSLPEPQRRAAPAPYLAPRLPRPRTGAR